MTARHFNPQVALSSAVKSAKDMVAATVLRHPDDADVSISTSDHYLAWREYEEVRGTMDSLDGLESLVHSHLCVAQHRVSSSVWNFRGADANPVESVAVATQIVPDPCPKVCYYERSDIDGIPILFVLAWGVESGKWHLITQCRFDLTGNRSPATAWRP